MYGNLQLLHIQLHIHLLQQHMMVLLPQQAGAQSDVSVWDGFAESWTQGDGTESNPYLIENAR